MSSMCIHYQMAQLHSKRFTKSLVVVHLIMTYNVYVWYDVKPYCTSTTKP